MFTIKLYKLGYKFPHLAKPTTLETLAEAEILAARVADRVFGIVGVELVYVEDLMYYVYASGVRIGRLTITPIYRKVRTK